MSKGFQIISEHYTVLKIAGIGGGVSRPQMSLVSSFWKKTGRLGYLGTFGIFMDVWGRLEMFRDV